MNQLPVLDTLKTAWKQIDGIKWQMWSVFLVVLAAIMGSGLFFGMLVVIARHDHAGVIAIILLLLVGFALLIALLGMIGASFGGMVRVGLAKVRGEDFSKLAFSCFTWPLFRRLTAACLYVYVIFFILFAVLYGIIYLIGFDYFTQHKHAISSFVLGIHPNVNAYLSFWSLFVKDIFLTAMTSLVSIWVIFIIPYVADRDLKALPAVKASFRLAALQWTRLFAILFIVVFIFKFFSFIFPALMQVVTGYLFVNLLFLLLAVVAFVWYLPFRVQTTVVAYLRLTGDRD